MFDVKSIDGDLKLVCGVGGGGYHSCKNSRRGDYLVEVRLALSRTEEDADRSVIMLGTREDGL